jgi:septal ring factor EnvC (AmiA/AmiB activator)
VPDTATLLALVALGFVAATATGAAVSMRRSLDSQRRRMQRKVLAINEQYRVLRQALRGAEADRDLLRRELRKVEDGRRDLELERQRLAEEVGRLEEERRRQRDELAALRTEPARSTDDVPAPGNGLEEPGKIGSLHREVPDEAAEARDQDPAQRTAVRRRSRASRSETEGAQLP